MDIGITNVKESNEFSRSLWSEMAKEFAKCAWECMQNSAFVI